MPPTSLAANSTRARATSQKLAGAYYTPAAVARTLVSWVVRNENDRLFDPSCGDGRFIACHPRSVGVEQDQSAAREAASRAPDAVVHRAEFFEWADATEERFDCAAGNPPFIRYQAFKGLTRARALAVCAQHGARFNGLTSSWAPFLVAAATLLAPGGRMAFVVPAEIGHAPYAAPLLEYLLAHFAHVQVVAVRDKLFPELSEDCWLLYADGYGGSADHIVITVWDQFVPAARPPALGLRVDVTEWRDVWRRRMRPYLLPPGARALYREVAGHDSSRRLGDVATVGIGYVSGANEFFHLRPSAAQSLGIPDVYLRPSVRNGRALPEGPITESTVRAWRHADKPMLLLCLRRGQQLPRPVVRYLDSPAGREARESYKCRSREPWYAVPDVRVPDYMLSYMSGRFAALVHNEAGVVCTNAVHAVRVRDREQANRLLPQWRSPFVQLSCELEGHALGGGMLKLEPREAAQVLLPAPELAPLLADAEVSIWTSALQRWRHYGTQE